MNLAIVGMQLTAMPTEISAQDQNPIIAMKWLVSRECMSW